MLSLGEPTLKKNLLILCSLVIFSDQLDEEKLNLFTSKANQLSNQIDLTRQLFVQNEPELDLDNFRTTDLGSEKSEFGLDNFRTTDLGSEKSEFGLDNFRTTDLGSEKSEFDLAESKFVPVECDDDVEPSEEEEDSTEGWFRLVFH